MGDKLCLICGKPVAGLKAVKIKEDAVLGFIRSVKRAMRIAQENELYVCEADLKSYRQKRDEFQKSMIIFSVLASLVVIVVLVGALLSGTVNLAALVVSFLIAVMIILFSLVVKYIPAAESNEPVFIQPRMAERIPESVQGGQQPAGQEPARAKEEEIPRQKTAGKKPAAKRKIKKA